MNLNGNRYEGSFKTIESKPPSLEGLGKIFFLNGDLHIGIFTDGNLNGYGRIFLKNGCIYEGEFRDNILNKHGKIILRDKTAIIKGNFRLGLLEGKGLYNIIIYIYIYVLYIDLSIYIYISSISIFLYIQIFILT